MQGLDIPEMGALGYPDFVTQRPNGRCSSSLSALYDRLAWPHAGRDDLFKPSRTAFAVPWLRQSVEFSIVRIIAGLRLASDDQDLGRPQGLPKSVLVAIS